MRRALYCHMLACSVSVDAFNMPLSSEINGRASARHSPYKPAKTEAAITTLSARLMLYLCAKVQHCFEADALMRMAAW